MVMFITNIVSFYRYYIWAFVGFLNDTMLDIQIHLLYTVNIWCIPMQTWLKLHCCSLIRIAFSIVIDLCTNTVNTSLIVLWQMSIVRVLVLSISYSCSIDWVKFNRTNVYYTCNWYLWNCTWPWQRTLDYDAMHGVITYGSLSRPNTNSNVY